MGCHVSPSVQRTFLANKPGTGMDEMTAMSPITVRPAPILSACCQDMCLSTNGHVPVHQWACSCPPMGMFLSADGHLPVYQWTYPCPPVGIFLSINGHLPVRQWTYTCPLLCMFPSTNLPMGQIPVQPRACFLAWLPYSAGSNLPRMQSVTHPGLEPGTMTRNWCQTSQHTRVVLKVQLDVPGTVIPNLDVTLLNSVVAGMVYRQSDRHSACCACLSPEAERCMFSTDFMEQLAPCTLI